MRSRERLWKLFILVFWFLICFGCKTEINRNTGLKNRMAVIEPDYSDVTIPPNIAPMNFCIREGGRSFKVIATSVTSGYQIKINSRDGIIRFPEKSWKKLLKNSNGDKIEFRILSYEKNNKSPEEYNPFFMFVSRDAIDPYLVYRLIYPGYYSWSQIKIIQRSVESFSESSLFDNQIMEKNCVNCHSFNSNNPDRFLIHVRGSLGGTYFFDDGKITRTDPKIDEMPGGATYPSWHPEGRFVAFSSNQVRQSFYSVPEKKIEVFDLVSSIILFDRKTNEIITVKESDTTKYLRTFPSWSPDGKYLYYCRAVQFINASDPTLEQIMMTHYNLVRKSFDPESRTFGETEIVFNAAGIKKSASFPRISPDGRYLVFTLHDYGTFPIWHQEADLWLLDLQNKQVRKMSLNSDKTESYHAWSSNGRWMVFSSKRLDGRSTRPYFAYIDTSGNQGKEFVLPQRDPLLYDRMLESFNIPEFVKGKIKPGPRDFADAASQISVKSKPGNKSGEPVQKPKDLKLKKSDGLIHE